MMLARYGIRGIILENISDTFKIVLIDDNKVELKDGQEYEGLGNYELHSKLKLIYVKFIDHYTSINMR